MMKRLIAIISLCFMIMFSFSFAVMAGEERVYDEAGLFTQEDVKKLETDIQSFKDTSGMDMAVMTIDQAGGRSASQYAEDVYIEKNLGTGPEYSGVLLLIDMDNRELYVKTAGAMTKFITDARNEAILDNVYAGAEQNDFVASADSFISSVTQFYKKGIPGNQYTYDSQTGKITRHLSIRWYEALIALGVSLFAAAVPCLNIRRQYAMKQQHEQAENYLMAYRGTSQFVYADQADNLLDKHVSQRIIAAPPPGSGGQGGSGGGSPAGRSTVHTNSGRTFGGGGRKF